MLHVVAFRLMLRQVGHVTETTPLRLLFLENYESYYYLK
jgi:hypothetical protein